MKFYLNFFAGSKSEFFKISIIYSFALTLLGCEVTLSTPEGTETTSSSPAKAVQKVSPSLSYSSDSGKGILNQAITITPTSVSSGDSNTTVRSCRIQPGSPNASNFPSTLNINSSSCVVSGTPTTSLAQTEFTVEITNSDSASSTAKLILSVAGAADRIVLVSGDSQTGSIGSTSNTMKVQVLDALGNPYPGGYSLGIFRMLGFDYTAPTSLITTDVNGYASFTPNMGFSPNSWKIAPIGSTLPDASSTGGTKVLFNSTPTSLGIGTFAAKVDITTGSGPNQVISADLNGDGKLDLVSTQYSGSLISVLLGNGNGTFATKVDYSVGSQPWFLASGDFNRDGKVDLAVTNSSSNTVSILIGNGDGTFATKVDYATGSTPRRIAVADFNSDGSLDLAVSNNVANTMSILLGNGNGTFAAKVDYATGSSPYAGLAIADFNKDGKLDIAATNYGASPGISVFIGNGNGTFQTKVDYAAGSSTTSAVTGDFNSDGNLDLAVSNESSASVSVLMGNGNGTFAAKVDYGTQTSPFGLKTGDFNGDGKLDLVSGNFGSASMSVLLNNGNGTFATKVDYAAGTSSAILETGDFNGDRKLDIVVPNRATSTLSLFLGN